MQAQSNSLSAHLNLLLSKTQKMRCPWHVFPQEKAWKGKLPLFFFYMEVVCQQLAPLVLLLSVKISCQAGCTYVTLGSHGHTLLSLPLQTGNQSLCPGYSVVGLQLFLLLLPLLGIMKDVASPNSKSFACGSGR